MNESLVPIETFTQFQKSYSRTINLLYDMQECLHNDVVDVKIATGMATGCRCASCQVYFVTLTYNFLNKKWVKGSEEPLFFEGEVVGEDDDLGPAFYNAFEQIKKLKEQYA